MADLPGYDELFRTFVTEAVYRSVLAGRSDITTASFTTPGTDANILAAGAASVGAECIRQLAIVHRDRLLATATGEALDRWIYDHYIDPVTLGGMTRHDASAARVRLTLSRPLAGAAGVVSAGSRFATPGSAAYPQGVEFSIVDDVRFAGATLTATVDALAAQAGSVGNVAIGAVSVVRGMLFDPAIVVTNATKGAGGNPREPDEAFRNRARSFWRALRRGTIGAIQFGAMSVTGIASALASEVPLTDPDTGVEFARWTSLAVADADGNANASMLAAVQAVLDEYRPVGSTVNVIPGAAQTVPWVVTCTFIAGTDTVAAKARIVAGLVGLTNGLAAGEALESGAGYEIVRRDLAVVPGTAVIVSPSGRTVPYVSLSVVGVLRTSAQYVRIN